MITIITVNWNSYDFLRLMIESLERFSHLPYKLIVIDNSSEPINIQAPNVHQFMMPTNIGHGRGLNHGVVKALELFPRHPYVMFLDVDCHILLHGWELLFLDKMKNYDLIGGKGVPSKPIRPSCMFMKQPLCRYDWADSQGYRGNRQTPEGYDVAIKAYYKIMADNYPICFLEQKPNRYNTANGEEWAINDIPVVYHHWHGSHLKERQADFLNVNLQEDKNKLFSNIPWRLL